MLPAAEVWLSPYGWSQAMLSKHAKAMLIAICQCVARPTAPCDSMECECGNQEFEDRMYVYQYDIYPQNH